MLPLPLVSINLDNLSKIISLIGNEVYLTNITVDINSIQLDFFKTLSEDILDPIKDFNNLLIQEIEKKFSGIYKFDSSESYDDDNIFYTLIISVV